MHSSLRVKTSGVEQALRIEGVLKVAMDLQQRGRQWRKYAIG
jgi:hypothetical protein